MNINSRLSHTHTTRGIHPHRSDSRRCVPQALDAVRRWHRYAVTQNLYRRLLTAHNFALSWAAFRRWRETAKTKCVARALAVKSRVQKRTSNELTRPTPMKDSTLTARLPDFPLHPPISKTLNSTDKMCEQRGSHVAMSHRKDLLLKAWILWKWKWQAMTSTEETTEPSSQDLIAMHREPTEKFAPSRITHIFSGTKSDLTKSTAMTHTVNAEPQSASQIKTIPPQTIQTASSGKTQSMNTITMLSSSVLDPFSSEWRLDGRKSPKLFGNQSLADSNARMDRVSKRLGISTIDLSRIDEQQPLTNINVEQFLQDEIDYLQQQTDLLSPPTFGQL